MVADTMRRATMGYFIVGVVMFGSGFIGLGDTGIVQFFFAGGTAGGEATGTLQAMNDVLGGVGGRFGIGAFAAAILAVVRFIQNVIVFMFWPFLTLQSLNAPLEVSLLLGGTPVVLFFFGLINLLATR